MAKNPTIPTMRCELIEAGDTIELMIYSVIGATWDGTGVTASDVVSKLSANRKAKTINLRINSDGGVVTDAMAIFNSLKRHKARKVVDIEGIAASAASFIAMAGDEIRIAKNAWVMIHEPATYVFGDAEALRETVTLLDKSAEMLAETYAERSGKTSEEVREMMKAETWFTGEEAVAAGFADELIDESNPILNVVDPSVFSKAPAELLARLKEQQAAIPPNKEPIMDAKIFAEYAQANPDIVKPFIDQGRKAGIADARAELKAFADAFPNDPGYAMKQFASGKTLDEAKEIKAEADRIAAETAAAIKAKDEEIAKLRAQLDGQPPVPSAPAKPASDPTSPEGKWEANADDCQTRFGGNKANFLAYHKAVAEGRIKIAGK